jgi:sortase A
VRPAPREGDLLGRIELPRLGLVALVHEGVRESTLLRGAGHVPGTRLPGEPGNVALAAHRDMHFRKLREVREGDLVQLLTLEGERHYRVAEIEITRPEDVSSLAPSTHDRLTLVTCYPFNYVGRAPRRFVVSAVAADAGFAAADGEVAAQPR